MANVNRRNIIESVNHSFLNFIFFRPFIIMVLFFVKVIRHKADKPALLLNGLFYLTNGGIKKIMTI